MHSAVGFIGVVFFVVVVVGGGVVVVVGGGVVVVIVDAVVDVGIGGLGGLIPIILKRNINSSVCRGWAPVGVGGLICVHVGACVCARVRARVCVYVYACLRTCVRACIYMEWHSPA